MWSRLFRRWTRPLDAAFRAAGVAASEGAAAALGLAGVDLTEGLDVIRGWSEEVKFAEKLSVANDATLLFAAGTPDGWGLAIVAGTGSIAFVLDAQGKDARAGGWGYILGDEGSRVPGRAARAAGRVPHGRRDR